jgi:hypothetical protein
LRATMAFMACGIRICAQQEAVKRHNERWVKQRQTEGSRQTRQATRENAMRAGQKTGS